MDTIDSQPSRRCANACSTTCACASSSPRRRPATSAPYASSPPSSSARPTPPRVEDLRRFQLHLVDTGTSPITLNATITGLKFFFDVTLGRGELMAKMQPVRVPRTLPVVLSREEVARLIAAAPQPEAPDGAVGGLRRRAARQRGRRAEGRRHRQPAHDAARRAGQGPQGPLRHAPPVLLERLRAWWRVGHAQGKMLPGGWLFPGLDPMDPLTARQLNRAIHAAADAAEHRQARVDAHAAPQLRHPPAGAEGRHPRDPGAARPQEAGDHGASTPTWPPTCCAR